MQLLRDQCERQPDQPVGSIPRQAMERVDSSQAPGGAVGSKAGAEWQRGPPLRWWDTCPASHHDRGRPNPPADSEPTAGDWIRSKEIWSATDAAEARAAASEVSSPGIHDAVELLRTARSTALSADSSAGADTRLASAGGERQGRPINCRAWAGPRTWPLPMTSVVISQGPQGLQTGFHSSASWFVRRRRFVPAGSTV